MKTKGMEDPEINQQIQSPHFDKGVRSIHWKRQSHQQNSAKKTDVCM